MLKKQMPQTMAWVAFIAALGASVMLLFLPIYTKQTTPAINAVTGEVTGQAVTTTATLLEVNGARVIIPLLIPPLLAGLGLLAVLRARRFRPLFVWLAAFLLAGFVLITGFSIGIFYVPAMILAMTAAIVTQMRGDTMSEITITKKSRFV